MATVSEKTHAKADPAHVWCRVRNIRWPETLTDMTASVEPTSETTRDCTMDGGSELKETIITVDNSIHRVAYTVAESPFEVTHRNASLQALADGEETPPLWVVDVLPDPVGMPPKRR